MRAVSLGTGVVAVCWLALAGSGPAGNAGAFNELPLYSAGDRADGLPLVAVLRRDDTANYVSFVYGDCVPEDDAGCAPPAEIQVWPACRRHLALYDSQASGGLAAERTSIRGVPAAVFDEGARLELQTGSSTVVVFADSRGRAARVARALRAVNGSEPAGSRPLPPPDPGALEGTLDC